MKLADRYFELLAGSRYYELAQQWEAEEDSEKKSKLKAALLAEKFKSLLAVAATYTGALALIGVLDLLLKEKEEE